MPQVQALKVPCACKHEIQSGDSWDSVAKEYSTSAEGLRRLNPLLTELTPKKVGHAGTAVSAATLGGSRHVDES